MVEKGARRANWGYDADDEKTAAAIFTARIVEYASNGRVTEIHPVIADLEKNAERKDGGISDIQRADGYTSVLDVIEKTKAAPKPPRKTKTPGKGKAKDGDEL